jgi:hypothetical protein
MTLPSLPLLALTALCFPVLAAGALRRTSLGLGLLLAALPLLSISRRLFADSSVPFPSPESVAVLLVAGCDIARRVAQGRAGRVTRKAGRGQTAIGIALGVFLLAGLASSLLSEDPQTSLRILFCGGVLPLMVFGMAAQTEENLTDIRHILLGFFALVLQTAVYAALTYAQRQATSPGEHHLYAWMYNEANAVNLFVVPSVAVSVIVPAIPLAVWYWQYHRSLDARANRASDMLLSLLVLVGVFLATVLSLSRGSWLGVGVALVGSVPMLLRRSRIRSIALFAGVCLLLYFSGVTDLARAAFSFRMTPGHALHGTAVRYANVLLALQSAPAHLLTGVGLGQYPVVYSEFPTAPASLMPPLWFAHNLLLTLIPEVGLLGTLALTAVVAGGVVRGMRTDRDSPDGPSAAAWLALRRAVAVGVVSYMAIAVTAGLHLVSYLESSDPGSTHFMSTGSLVVFLLLGLNAALVRGGPKPAAIPAVQTAMAS